MPQSSPDGGMNRATALSILIGAGVPSLFLLVVAFIFSPLLGLLLVLALVIGAGMAKTRWPQLFAALKKPKKEPVTPASQNSVSSSSGRNPVHNYMMLVSINAANQQRIAVNDSPFTIGRDADCSYVLDYGMVSRHHLTITYSAVDNLCYVQDHSSNGTFLNSQRLRKGNRTALHQGDTIQISGIIFSVEYLHY